MAERVSELRAMLRGMEPVLHRERMVFVQVAAEAAVPDGIFAMIREAEGVTLILTEAAAARAGLRAEFGAAQITLTVLSDLAAVGLTAAFSGALAAAGISCNVVAGVSHDHLFVGWEDAGRAMAVLRDLQAGAG